jgi:D-xylonolactonase
MDFKLALPVRAHLGEGLHWDTARSVLWMVDIHGRRLIQWDLAAPTWREWSTPQRIGWAIPRSGSDQLLMGLQEGMALARINDLANPHWVARPFEGRPELRLNDAKADASGAVWAGSMNNDDDSRSDGCLFRLTADARLETVDTGYRVANGPAIHPDGRLLMHTDSARRTIYAFDLDTSDGTLSRRRVWKQFDQTEGYPDGMCFDSDSHLWVAHWGAGMVSRFAPDGSLVRRIELPVRNATNVCFAGTDRDRLFVTSAAADQARPDAHDAPHGDLFEILSPCTSGARGCSWGGSTGVSAARSDC